MLNIVSVVLCGILTWPHTRRTGRGDVILTIVEVAITLAMTSDLLGPYGENLFLSSPTGSFSAAVEDWYNEGSQYDYNNPGFSVGDLRGFG